MSPLLSSVEALREIDSVCDRFEAEWLAGHKPRVEDFLSDAVVGDREAWLSALLDVQRELICRDNAPAPVAAAPLTVPPATASAVATVRLRVTAGPYIGREFQFDQHETLLAGRSAFAQLRLVDDVHFSRNHFRLEVNPPECHLIDLDSTNGTFVNGKRVRQKDLKDGDLVLVGDTELTVTSFDPQATLLRVVPPSARPKRPEVVRGSPDHAHATDRKVSSASLPEGADEQGNLLSNDLHGGGSPVHSPPAVTGYRIENEVGWGDLGVTYRATRLATGEPCALKILSPADRMNDRTVQSFLREAGVLNQLHHPHIVRLLDLGSANGLLYIATEFVSAVRWDVAMEKATPQTRIRLACGLICQVLDALEYAHTRSFVHRDIKPSNVLVRRDGRRLVAKLSDFGLAKQYADAGLSQITHDGDVLGSLPYMSPEQFIDSRHAKPTCDLYSAGATLYRLLAGHDPFLFAKGKCKFLAILEDDPIPIRQSFPQVPAALAEIVHRALAKEPQQRFSSAAEMRHVLLPFARR
jgi:serine/threonine-protein kinase